MSVSASYLRRLVIAVIVIGCAAANAGCSSGSHAAPSGGHSPAAESPAAAAKVPDPASVAQIKSRTLGPQAEGGFRFLGAPGTVAQRSAPKPFDPPAGSADHVCNALIVPAEFLPQGFLSSGTSVFPPVDRRASTPANWFEYIEVYPAGGAESIEAQLRTLLGHCRRFLWAVPSAMAVWMRAEVTSLPGIGDSTMYASMRTLTAPPGGSFLAWDWVLIRSGNTLIALDDGGSALPAPAAPNTVMRQLVKVAWRRYSRPGSPAPRL